MSPLLADERIGREFQTVDEVESLPVGAVVIDSDGDAWQRAAASGSWYPAAMASHAGQGQAAVAVTSWTLAEDFGSLLLVWLPPEAVNPR